MNHSADGASDLVYPPDSGETVIQVEGLTRRFGDFVAVDHVTFSVLRGEVVGYLGPNGSGKTTTIRMLLGLLRPSEGMARVLDFDVVRQSEPLRQHVGYMSQKFSLYHDLTVRENLQFYAGVYGVRSRARLDEVLELVGLQDQQKVRINSLSVGWRQRLALGTAIVHSPELLFLDEPTSGVDPIARRTFWDLIYELVSQGITVLVTTHYMDEAEYCGRLGIMRQGKLLAFDTPTRLKETVLRGAAWDVYADGAPSKLDGAPSKLDGVTDEWEAGTSDQLGGGTPVELRGGTPVEPRGGSIQQAVDILEFLQTCSLVERAVLVSDRVRAITPPGVDQQALQVQLVGYGAASLKLEQVEPSLEDVFLALSASG